MTQKLEQGSIAFVDVPTRIPDLSPSEGVTLLPLLDIIRDSIERIRGATPPLLIFDELACFEWIGHSSVDISRFVRALVACCAKASSEMPLHPLPLLSKTRLNTQSGVLLAVRYHIATLDDLDNVLRILLQLSAYHIEVLPLSSGKSGAVSGEVSRLLSAVAY
jgi:hypothetical protein